MKKEIWFRAKHYGAGWYPCSWQGWVVILTFIFLIIINSFIIDSLFQAEKIRSIAFAIQMIVLTSILIFISKAKGEKFTWRWGKNKKWKK